MSDMAILRQLPLSRLQSSAEVHQDSTERRERDVDFGNLESTRSVACHVSCLGRYRMV